MKTNLNFPVGLDDLQAHHAHLPGVCATNGSRNPIDTQAHWDWRNPLTVLPLGVAVLTVISVVLWLLQQL
jgi:hypothetical protein